MLDLKLVGGFMINLYSKWNTKNFMFAVIQLHEFASKRKGNGNIAKKHTQRPQYNVVCQTLVARLCYREALS
jgi:hypothetical protein